MPKLYDVQCLIRVHYNDDKLYMPGAEIKAVPEEVLKGLKKAQAVSVTKEYEAGEAPKGDKGADKPITEPVKDNTPGKADEQPVIDDKAKAEREAALAAAKAQAKATKKQKAEK